MKYIFSLIILTISLPASSLTIFPESASLKQGEQTEFFVTGYTAESIDDLQWVAVKGNMTRRTRAILPGVTMEAGQIQVSKINKVIYTAPHKAGTYSIAVTDNIEIAVAEIEVVDISDAIVMVEILGERTFTVDDSMALSLQAWLPNLTQQDYTTNANWESSDTNIVQVDENGILTALSAGETTISADLAGQTDHIQVTVQAKTPLLALEGDT